MSKPGFLRSFLLGVLLLSPIYGSSQSDTPRLHIPFRLTQNPPLPPSSTGLTLTINGRSAAVEKVLGSDTAFCDNPGNRIIILAVAGGAYSQDLAQVLTAIHQGVMRAGDRLILCTPLGSETFDRSSAETEPWLSQAQSRLQDDLTVFTALMDKMQKDLASMRLGFSPRISDTKWLRLFNRYEPMANRLIDQVLAAYLGPLSQAFGQLNAVNRPVWLLLFDEDLPLAARIGWPLVDESRTDKLKPATKDRLLGFGKRLQAVEMTDLTDLSDEMMLRGIHLIGFKTREQTPPSPSSQGILTFICRQNGLSPGSFSHSQAAMSRLLGHRDALWSLTTPFDGRIEDKRLQLQGNPDIGPIAHPTRIRAEAFAAPSRQPRPPLTVDAVQIEGEDLVCRISGIVMKDKQGGRLRLRVRIQDEASNGRFDQEKELEAQEPVLSVRIPLPDDIRGYLGLIVDVMDLEDEARVQKRVYLKRGD